MYSSVHWSLVDCHLSCIYFPGYYVSYFIYYNTTCCYFQHLIVSKCPAKNKASRWKHLLWMRTWEKTVIATFLHVCSFFPYKTRGSFHDKESAAIWLYIIDRVRLLETHPCSMGKQIFHLSSRFSHPLMTMIAGCNQSDVVLSVLRFC